MRGGVRGGVRDGTEIPIDTYCNPFKLHINV